MKADEIRVVRLKAEPHHIIFYRDRFLIEELDGLKRKTGNFFVLGLGYYGEGKNVIWKPSGFTFKKDAFEPVKIEVEHPEWIVAGIILGERSHRIYVTKPSVNVKGGRLDPHAFAVWQQWPKWLSEEFREECRKQSSRFSPSTLAIESLRGEWPTVNLAAVRAHLTRLNLPEPWSQ